MGSRWWKPIPADLTTGTIRYRKRTYSSQIILPIDICHLPFFLRKDSVDPGALLAVSTCRECCSGPCSSPPPYQLVALLFPHLHCAHRLSQHGNFSRYYSTGPCQDCTTCWSFRPDVSPLTRVPRRSRDSMVDRVAFLRVAHGRRLWGIAIHVVSPPHMADRHTSTDSRFIGPLPSLNRLDAKWVHQFSSHFKHLHSPQGTLVGIQ